MQPTFRTDLECSREEQQGVVFYRIDDPESKQTFRLYEIEYLIAQKLDGVRTPQEVIKAVKEEYNFDISEADLDKFIQQLETMGFVKPGDAPRAPVAPETPTPIELPPESTLPAAAIITQEMTAPPVDLDAPMALGTAELDLESTAANVPPQGPRPTLAEAMQDGSTQVGGPSASDMEVEAEAEAEADSAAPQPTGVDRAELTRLLKSAFLHVKQGYVVHARDYFLAAKELNPDDPRLLRLASSVEILEDKPEPTELHKLWVQCAESFPDVAADIGPMLAAKGGQADGLVAHAAKRTTQAWHADVRTRSRLTLFLLALVGFGAFGVYYSVHTLRLFQGASRVLTESLSATRAPVFFPGTAAKISPVREVWLNFGSDGKAGDMPKVGSRVEGGEVIAALDLSAPLNKQLKAVHAAIAKADADYEKVARNLEKAMTERQSAEAERDGAEEHIKQLRPQSVLKQDASARKELDMWKKQLAKANKKLSLLTKKERGPRAMEAKAKKKQDLAHKRLTMLEDKMGDKLLRAPFAGQIVDVKVAPGQSVTPSTQAVLVRDPVWARLTFLVKKKVTLQQGAEVFVSVKGGAPLPAKLGNITELPSNSGIQLHVDIADPAGAMLTMPPESFHLVAEFAEHAFRVRSAALVAPAGNTAQVLVYGGGRVNRVGVQVLDQSGGDSLLRDPQGRELHDGTQVVIARVDGQPLDTLGEGDAVEAELAVNNAPTPSAVAPAGKP